MSGLCPGHITFRVTSGYELFDHTADLGIRGFGRTSEEIVEAMTAGFYAAVGDLALREGGETCRVTVTGEDEAVLLRDYLALLLLRLERHLQVLKIDRVVRFGGGELSVEGTWRGVDEERSEFLREVKAITYHELSLVRTEQGYEARVIVDI